MSHLFLLFCGIQLLAESDFAWFNVLNSFSYPLDFETGFGPFLIWLSLFTLAIYFVTSSDSGSLIVDNLASNGFERTHWIQRIFWAFTEGAVATALLVAGGSQALRSLQSASILAGLPFTAMLALMCISIHRMCIRAEKNDKEDVETSLQSEYKSFKIFAMPIFGGVFDIFEYLISCGCVHPVRKEFMPFPSSQELIDFAVATILPFVPLYQIYSKFAPKESDKTSNMVGAAIYGSIFIMWVVLFALMGSVSRGLRGFAWCLFLFNGCILSVLRSKFSSILTSSCLLLSSTRYFCWQFDHGLTRFFLFFLTAVNFRARFGIDGNMVADYMLSCFMWPQIIVQMARELESNPIEKEDVEV
jgi:hypothetical protein